MQHSATCGVRSMCELRHTAPRKAPREERKWQRRTRVSSTVSAKPDFVSRSPGSSATPEMTRARSCSKRLAPQRRSYVRSPMKSSDGFRHRRALRGPAHGTGPRRVPRARAAHRGRLAPPAPARGAPGRLQASRLRRGPRASLRRRGPLALGPLAPGPPAPGHLAPGHLARARPGAPRASQSRLPDHPIALGLRARRRRWRTETARIQILADAVERLAGIARREAPHLVVEAVTRTEQHLPVADQCVERSRGRGGGPPTRCPRKS